jgi:hypothetical protein
LGFFAGSGDVNGLAGEVAVLLELILTGLTADEIVEFVGLNDPGVPDGLEAGVVLLALFADAVGVLLPPVSDVFVGLRAQSFWGARAAALSRLAAHGYSGAQLSEARGYRLPFVHRRVKRTVVESRRAALHHQVLREHFLERPSPDFVDQKLAALQQRFDDRSGPWPERTTARAEVIALMAKSGLRRVDIAERMGLNQKSVGRLGARFGIEFPESGHKSEAYSVDEVLVRMLGGESVNDIALSVGRTAPSVMEALRIRGLTKPAIDVPDTD